jgi:hypothetical protein
VNNAELDASQAYRSRFVVELPKVDSRLHGAVMGRLWRQKRDIRASKHGFGAGNAESKAAWCSSDACVMAVNHPPMARPRTRRR